MKENIPKGIFEDLITNGLRVEIEGIPPTLIVEEEEVDAAELPIRLNRHLSKVLLRTLESFSENEMNEEEMDAFAKRMYLQIMGTLFQQEENAGEQISDPNF